MPSTRTRPRPSCRTRRTIHLSGERGPAPYFTNYVQQQLIDRYGAGRVFGGGLRVRTTIDLNVQRFARQAITKWLTDPNGPSAALVAVDPRDGSVLAMIGGNNYRKSQFNLAVQGERQPGSSFKPFVLATALKDGISPDSEFESGPVSIPLGDKLWYVHNYENSDLGRISLATATEVSDNTVYAQLTQLVGPGAIVRTAKKLGISSPLKNYFAIGLGAEAVNPLEMARAFSAFDNGGLRIDGAAFGNHPRAISDVRNEAGRIVDNNLPVGRHVLTANTAALVTSLLQGVVRAGTGKRAQLSDGRPVAGKTGTTENYGDAWFVGYTPQLVAAVWVGYPTTAEADADRVQRRRGRRRHLPGADLEELHGADARVPARPAGGLPERLSPLLGAAHGRLPARAARARQRQLQQHEAAALLRRRAPGADRELQGERGRGAEGGRQHDLRGERPPRRAAADAAVRLRAGEAAAEARRRRRGSSRPGDALVLREGDARGAEGAAGQGAEGGRPAARAGQGAPQAAAPEVEGRRRRRLADVKVIAQTRTGAWPASADSSSRSVGKARLRKREPASA